MKATRILLFLSPLLLFLPSLISVDESPGLLIVNAIYRGMLGRFPWNAIMMFLCYSYAHQLGREAWPWVVGSLVFPFLAPFVLAFVPPDYDSPAYLQRKRNARPGPAKAAGGTFETRFPLLAAYLANLPQAARLEPQVRMEPVMANFEFAVFVASGKLNDFVDRAAARNFTVWANAEDGGFRVFGAGMVETAAIDSVTTWLRQAAPERKVATAVHPAEGLTKFFEHYPEAS